MLEIWDLVWAKSKPIEWDKDGRPIKSSKSLITIQYFDESQNRVFAYSSLTKKILEIKGWKVLNAQRFEELKTILIGQRISNIEEVIVLLKPKPKYEQLTLF